LSQDFAVIIVKAPKQCSQSKVFDLSLTYLSLQEARPLKFTQQVALRNISQWPSLARARVRACRVI